MADVKIGSTCTINGVDAYDSFKADLVSITPTPGNVESVYSVIGAKSKIDLHDMDISTGSLGVKFYVYGDTKNDMKLNTSRLLSSCSNCVISTDEDQFEYECVYNGCEIEFSEIEWYNIVTISFIAICRLPLESRTANGTFISIKNDGAVQSGCRITFESETELDEITIAGIKVEDVHANQKLCIDGIDGEVVRIDGAGTKINAFGDTDMIDFPKVQPGQNDFTSSKPVSWRIEWYPLFLIV